jgi:hypothetical protein
MSQRSARSMAAAVAASREPASISAETHSEVVAARNAWCEPGTGA